MGYNTVYLECLTGNEAINFYIKYSGVVKENINYPISDFTVKADIVFYEDINKLKELLEK